ncbi:MAG: nickel pincer cofactor biosynthesis protein LarC [Bacteroidales bacterium]
MKVLFYDCFSGISGDMNLGAMIDLGIEKSYLVSELNKLNLKGWELIAGKDQRHGIMGTKVTVRQTIHEHAHRHLSDIEKIITDSSLSEENKKLSSKIFLKVAEAEAAVHGIPVDAVHFHEVGAIDSIIDIVGAAICFNALAVEAVHVSEVELGSGFVDCAHGKLPVPAPATAEIIKGIPSRTGGVDFEATTPTGAAILSVLGTDFGASGAVKFEKTAYGVGHKDHPVVPNLLRVSLGEKTGNAGSGHDALLIQCNIDDMNPEFYEHISDRLFKAGASDVYYSHTIMKKGRPGIVMNVICESGLDDKIKEIIFTESTTLGLRTFRFQKDTLVRELRKLSTKYGEVTFKHSFLNGNEVSVKPEFEDCRKIASETGTPLKEVYNFLISEITQRKNKI